MLTRKERPLKQEPNQSPGAGAAISGTGGLGRDVSGDQLSSLSHLLHPEKCIHSSPPGPLPQSKF